MTMPRRLLLLLALCLPAAAQDLRARVDGLAAPFVERKLVVGMVAGILPGEGRPPQVFGYGRLAADREGVPDGDTVYEIGSMSKVFTGVLLACLAGDGLVRLDQPLRELLPQDLRVPKRGKEITLLHLTTHTSSLPRMPTNFFPRDPGNPFADYSVEQLYDFVSTCELPRDVGERYEYSNLAAGLLGHVLARRAKKSYELLLLDRIAVPLGMKSTRIGLTDAMKKRLAPGHNLAGVPVKNWDIVTLAGAGGIRSTVHDMLLFLKANLTVGTTPLALAMARARKVYYQPPDENAHAMGLGWHIAPKTGSRWHNGQTGGYHAIMSVNLEQRTALVVLSNSATGAVDRFGANVAALLAGRLDRKQVEIDPAILDAYVGKYPLTPRFVLTVTLEEGKLMVQATNQARYQVFPESETKFFYRITDAQITFVKQNGKVTGLILHQGGRDTPAKKVE